MKPTLFLLFSLISSFCIHAEENISLKQNSKTGWTGWTIATHQNYRGVWMNSTLVIIDPSGKKFTFTASDPFIEKWGFSDNDKTIVVRSRFAHGPSLIEKFDLTSGKLIDQCKGSNYLKDTPEWARPWCDEAEQGAAANP